MELNTQSITVPALQALYYAVGRTGSHHKQSGNLSHRLVVKTINPDFQSQEAGQKAARINPQSVGGVPARSVLEVL